MENPYASPEITSDDYLQIVRETYGGIGRLAFFGIWVGLTFVQNMLQELAVANGRPLAAVLVMLAVIVGYFVVVAYRLKNTGMNPWWCLTLLIPLVNFFIWFRCLICPEGYSDTKKLDLAGKILVGIILGIVVLIVGLLILGTVFFGFN